MASRDLVRKGKARALLPNGKRGSDRIRASPVAENLDSQGTLESSQLSLFVVNSDGAARREGQQNRSPILDLISTDSDQAPTVTCSNGTARPDSAQAWTRFRGDPGK